MQSTHLPLVSPQKNLKSILLAILFFFICTGALAYGIRVTMRGTTTGVDFSVYYWVGHQALLHGISPYSQELAEQTQIAVYGTLAPPGKDQVTYVNPAYTLYVIFPLVRLDYANAQALWMAFNLVLWVLIPRILLPRAPSWMVATLLFFYPIAFTLIVGNFDTLFGIILLTFFCLFVFHDERSRNLQILTGILIAWSTSKPQFIWALFLFAVLVVIKRKLWPLAVSFIASFFVLMGTSLLIFPSWPKQWIPRLFAYSQYIPPASPITLFLRYIAPNDIASVLSTGITLIGFGFTGLLLLRWWRGANSTPDQIRLLAWLGYFTYVSHLFPKSCEQIIVMIPFFIWSALAYKRQKTAVILFWIMGLAVSWFAFFIDPLKLTPNGIYEWPVLFFTVWLAYVWFARPAQPQQILPA